MSSRLRSLIPWILILGPIVMGSLPAFGAIQLNGAVGDLPSTTIVINEVEYDSIQGGTDSQYEWFELYNLTPVTQTLSGWTIADNSANDTIPNVAIGPNGFCIVAATTAGFLTNYPGYTGCLVAIADGVIGSGLSNSGDRLTLRDAASTVIDGINWEADTTYFNCTGFPCGAGAGPGQSLEREPLGQDTDTAADFVLRFAPSPGEQGINVTATPSNTPTPTNTPTAGPSPTPTAGPYDVAMGEYFFAPQVYTITVGQSVLWRNIGIAPEGHTTTSDTGLWDSGQVFYNETFSFTFTTPGDYPYYCVFHGAPGGIGMAGVIHVSPPVGAHLVINEFSARSSPEWIEVHNPTGASVNLAGWSLTSDIGLLNLPLTGTLAPGAFLAVDTPGTNLDNEGDVIRLKDNTSADVDVVGYGFRGGAPVSPFTPATSSGRVADGVDTDNDADDFNFATTATKGAANAGNIPAVNLGSSVIINEVDTFVPLVTDPDKVEIYNPGGSPVDLTGWGLSDGDAIAPLTGTLTVPAGGWLVLTEGVNWTVAMDYASTDVAYLLDDNGVRVDQLGYNPALDDPTTCYQRVPDGAGPNDGYNYASSGGGSTLFVLACTLGATNGNATPVPTPTNTPTATPTPGGSPTPTPTNTPIPGADHIVINEFNAKNSPEWIELYNPTGAAVDLTGWRLTTDVGLFNYVFPASTILNPGAFLSVNTTVGSLDNSGDIIRLKDAANVDVDVVGYGTRGGAPIPPFDFSTGRIVDGLDTDDLALDWNQAATMTQGGPNNVPPQGLGSGLIINELDGTNTTGGAEPDRLELYNPTCNDVDVFNWKVSDGDAIGVISHTVMIPAGGWAVLRPNVDYTTTTFGPDFTGSDVAYIFDDGGTRVDQIGWAGGPSESGANTRQRVNDGVGPNTGYDYVSSGGGTSWAVLPPTLGGSNLNRTLNISKSGDDVVLTWTADPAALAYRVYRGSTPYFTPGIPWAVVASPTYTDVGAISDPGSAYYAVSAVRTFCMEAPGESEYSNRVGAFDFALQAGPPGDTALNDIAIPLDVSAVITNAESLADWIEAEGPAPAPFGTVRQLLKWNAPLQNFEAWSHEFGFGDNFVVNVGDFIFLIIDENAPSMASFVGRVPAPGEVSFPLTPGTAAACALNFISLPFDQAALSTADLLSDAIGTPDATVVQALDWDAPLQNFLAWANVFGFGDNFPTSIGHPYILCLSDQNVPLQWP